MSKRLPSKNQRSKGVRVKHVLQICLLIGVCFWLVYQIKHSREKKKEFDDNGSKISDEDKAENLRLGRKDLPREEPMRNERPDDEEREEVEEEEETKNDQSETDNEIDDDDRMEKKDEDFVQENGGGDLDDQIETVDSSDEDRDPDQDQDQIGEHEAREEHYRGDDASSEVTHEGEDEEEEGQLLEEEAPDGTIDDNTPDGTETDDDTPEKNVEDDDDGITMVSRSRKVRHSALSTKQSNEHNGTENNTIQTDTESSNSSFVEKGIEISDSSQLKSIEGSVSDPGQAKNGTGSVDSENIRVEPNSTVSRETDYKDEVSKDNVGSNGTVQTEEREGSSEKLLETVDPTRPDPIDSTDTQIGQEMNEARTELETLPDFTKSLGNNNDNEEIAAE